MSEGDWYDADEVEKTVTAMADAVGTLGYAFVDVRPNIRRNKEDHTIDVTFDIQEGPRVYVERINISGNTRTLDKVIRREFRLAEGDAFIDRQGPAQPAAPARTSASSRRSTSRPRPARRRTRPTSRSRWSSRAPAKSRSAPATRRPSGILGDISIRERNLLGKGQDLRLGLSLGTLSTLIDLSFTEPYFLDRAVAAGFDIFRTSNDRQNIASYSDRSVGFALRAGWAFTEHTRQTVRYTLRQTRHLQRPALRLADRAVAGRLRRWSRRSPRRSPGIPATRASTRPRAGCCATRWPWPAWAAPSSTSAPPSTP